MKRGIWHQCGDKSQKVVDEFLKAGLGIGAIISPRDLKRSLSFNYSQSYRNVGAQTLLDYQFYVSDFANQHLRSFPISKYRMKVSQLNQLTDSDVNDIAAEIYSDNLYLGTSAVIAPAIIYEASRPDIVDLNNILYKAAKQAGDTYGVPTYATVILGRSLTNADGALGSLLSDITSLNPDGWYFGFEFDSDERIPSSIDDTLRFLKTGIGLACTGLPILHAYAGPMSLLSYAFGSTGCAIGHTRNMWHFKRARWQPKKSGGGRGPNPARFFSKALWGTIIYPDEIALLPKNIGDKLLTQSPYSVPTQSGLPWNEWDSYKHFLHIVFSEATNISKINDARNSLSYSVNILKEAEANHQEIANLGFKLKDKTSSYQTNWRLALETFLNDNAEDFDYLDLINF
jgi:hypothetical protein